MPLHRTLLAAVAALTLPACAEFHDEPPQTAVAIAVTPVPVAGAPGAALPGDLPAFVDVGRITAVSAEGAVDVEVTVGAPTPTRIACVADRIAKVHVEAKGDMLRIWTDRWSGHSSGPCTVHVGVPTLRSLDSSGAGRIRVLGHAEGLASVIASGAGAIEIASLSAASTRLELTGAADVQVQRLTARSVELNMSGAGTLHVAGSSERALVTCSGAGNLDARGLVAMDAEVEASGAGSISITASRRVNVDSSGVGSVSVAGRPAERHASKSGMGSVSFE